MTTIFTYRYLHKNAWLFYYVVHVMLTGVLCIIINTREIKEVEESKNSKCRHFDVPAPKWLILMLGSAYQYSLASFNRRKTTKIKKLKMTKI